ncbi:MAG: C10 family peptidase [Muribaculaceae bacterium]|nr:C10 family peptidase [Muribaculaceae bacterium]
MKKTIMLAVAAMAAFTASAELLAPARALDRALEQLPATSPARHALRAAALSAEPMMTVATRSAEAELYVFSNSGSLMIVSADSETPALLGYSTDYTPGAPLPPSLEALMQTYATEIAATRAGAVVMAPAGSRADFAPIEPLCKTAWNQDAPYNDLAPMLGTTRTYTGCVATAMAQVMKVHNYPPKGSGGTFSYYWQAGGKTLSLNYDNITFEWDNMLNSYNGTRDPAVNRNAVATLMQAVGYAAQMGYNTDGSGAISLNMAIGLVRNFDYDASLHFRMREWFSLTDWNSMVYNELAQGRPVYYDGHTIDNAGHAFVVDGYRSDGYFHLNWGWGGISNGYFLLSALDPEAQGIGGSTSGFDLGQSAFFGVVPNKGTEPAMAPLNFFSQGAFAVTTSSVALGGRAKFSYAAYNCGNFSVSGVSPAVCYTSVADGSKTWMRSTTVSGSLAVYNGVQFAQMDTPSDLAEGDYILTPGVYSTVIGEYFPVYAPLYMGQSVAATVSDGRIKFNGTQMPSIWASSIDVPDEIVTNRKFQANVTIEDRTDVPYIGKVALCIYDPGKSIKRATLTTFVANVDGNSSVEISVPATMANAAIPEGAYDLYLITADNNTRISDAIPVNIVVPADLGLLTASNLKLVDATPDNLEFTVNVAASSGNWKGTLWLEIHNRGDYTSYLKRFPAQVEIQSGKSTTLTLGGEFPEGIPGMSYTAYIYYTREGVEMEANGRQRMTFKLEENDAIDEVEAADDENVQLYDLTGRKVTTPRRGAIYITNTGKKLVY